MIDIMDRLRFDAVRCETQFSKGVAGNIEEAAKEIERLRACLQSIADMKEDEPREPDDMDWRARALECKRCATMALSNGELK